MHAFQECHCRALSKVFQSVEGPGNVLTLRCVREVARREKRLELKALARTKALSPLARAEVRRASPKFQGCRMRREFAWHCSHICILSGATLRASRCAKSRLRWSSLDLAMACSSHTSAALGSRKLSALAREQSEKWRGAPETHACGAHWS